MKYLALFESYKPFEWRKTKSDTYKFTDSKGNHYTVYFLGPYEAGEELGIDGHFWELEFLTQSKDYYAMTAAFEPFKVANVIFGPILNDFLQSKNPEALVINALDRSRYRLYLRTLQYTLSQDWQLKLDTQNHLIIIKPSRHD